MADNEEVDLGTIATGLTSEVAALRQELSDKEKEHKRSSKRLGIAILFLMLAFFGSLWNGYRIDQEAKERSLQACLNGNEGRAVIRGTFTDFVDLLIASGEDQPRTPEEEAARQQQIKEFKAQFESKIDTRLPSVDCEKLNH